MFLYPLLGILYLNKELSNEKEVFFMITKEMTVAKAIQDNPEIIQILSDENIDYCCGGNRPLATALEEKKLDVDSFINLLNRQKKNVNVTENPLDLSKKDLIAYIVKTHHVPELKWIDEMDKSLQKLINVHYENHGKELSDVYDTFLSIKADLIPHFAKEEQREFSDFTAGNDVDFSELEREHEHVGNMLKSLAEKTNNYTAPADGCATYQFTFKQLKDLQDDIHNHIFLENSILFVK